MGSVYHWFHTSRLTGRREQAGSRLTEEDARASLLDREAVSDSRIDMQPAVRLQSDVPPDAGDGAHGAYEPCRR